MTFDSCKVHFENCYTYAIFYSNYQTLQYAIFVLFFGNSFKLVLFPTLFLIMHNAGQVHHIICQKSSGSLGSDLRFAISHRLLVTDEVDWQGGEGPSVACLVFIRWGGDPHFPCLLTKHFLLKKIT